MILLRLYFEFFKTGLFAVGGGLATLPFLYDMGIRTGWFTSGDVADMIAVSESTPGPMGVNMATYVGYSTAGIPGSILAVLGLITPSIIIILIVAMILKQFKESDLVQRVFYGLRPASTALIAAAGIGVAKISLLKLEIFQESRKFLDLLNWKCILLAVVVWFVFKKLKVSPIWFIFASAAAGIIFQL